MNDKIKKLKSIFGDAKVSSMQSGDTLHLYVGSGADMDKSKARDIKKAHAKGESAEVDGVKTWITYNVIVDTTKEAADMFTWDKSGNKVKNERILVTVDADGKRTEKVLGTVFKNYE